MELTFLVSECEDTVTALGRKCKKAWQISVGPAPDYPRHNAHIDPPEIAEHDEVVPTKKL
jgi:hypothetical protein